MAKIHSLDSPVMVFGMSLFLWWSELALKGILRCSGVLPTRRMLILLQQMIVYSLALFAVSCGAQSWPVLFQVALDPTLKHLCRREWQTIS